MSFLAIKNISINWFFFNQLPESLIENTSNYIILKYYNNVTGSAGLGTINYHLEQQTLIIDTQVLDYINSNYKYTEIIKANVLETNRGNFAQLYKIVNNTISIKPAIVPKKQYITN